MEEKISVVQIGAELRELREKREITIEQVSAITKIRCDYLDAIEQGKLEQLPAGFYRRNFVREYCDLLGAAQLWQAYGQIFEEEKDQKRAGTAKAVNEQGEIQLVRHKEVTPDNGKAIIVAAGVILVAAVVFGFLTRGVNVKGKISQLDGGTATIIEQKKAEEEKAKQIAEEKARKLAEERAKAEESEHEAELAVQAAAETQKAAENNEPQAETVSEDIPQKLAKNELYIHAPEKPVKIIVKQQQNVIYDGEIKQGKSMKFKVEGNIPLRVRYENPNKTEVTYGGIEFKPLHPSSKVRSRYYWSDGTITFTPQKKADKQ